MYRTVQDNHNADDNNDGNHFVNLLPNLGYYNLTGKPKLRVVLA